MTNKKIKDNLRYFKGILIQETDYFYVFRGESKYCECFLKVDFVINNYRIKEFMIKAS